jgi:hypothetical protein
VPNPPNTPSDLNPMTPASPNGEPQNGQLPVTRPETVAPTAAPREPRTQTPKEALGASAGSGLFMASIQAAVGFAVVLGALTFGPYFWEKSQANATPSPAQGEKGKAAPAANQLPVAPAPSSPNPAPSGKLPPGNPTVGKQPGKGDIVDKLGENGRKTAPAKLNPLDKKEDDLLKDIK